MKISELKQKSDKELMGLLRETKAKSVELRFNVVGGNVKDVKNLRDSRVIIARIMTLLNKREESTNE